MLSPSDLYRRNAETGGWTDMSSDADFVAQAVENGLDLHVVGVVRPNESSDAKALSAGIAYTPALTQELMERAADSAIVQQQLADPEVDVFTGKSFDTLQEEARQGVDLGSLFSVDEQMLRSAFSFDTSALQGAFDPSGLDLSGISVDLSGVADPGRRRVARRGSARAGLLGDPGPGARGPPRSRPSSSNRSPSLAASSRWASWGTLARSTRRTRTWSRSSPRASRPTSRPRRRRASSPQIEEIAGPAVRERVQQIVTDYVSGELAPYLQSFMQSMSSQVGAAVSAQLQSAMTQVLSQYADQVAGGLSQLQSAFSVDADALAGAISFNMDAEDLASLMESYANASQLTYDNNLQTLGYATPTTRRRSRSTPRTSRPRSAWWDVIDAYNEEQRAAGNDDAVISYTDYVGVIMGSVTDIVNMISLVLIAFVSISLVVSSIMIGIITYISVLERKKEIGILRAIGASKRKRRERLQRGDLHRGPDLGRLCDCRGGGRLGSRERLGARGLQRRGHHEPSGGLRGRARVHLGGAHADRGPHPVQCRQPSRPPWRPSAASRHAPSRGLGSPF